MAIYFFGITGQYGCFSNFYPATFTEHGTTYYNSEQYFMKKKQELFDSKNHILSNKILEERDPKKIKSYGRNVKNYSESVWSQHRYQVMVQALKLKFGQNPELKTILDQTTGPIYECSPYDKVWGIGLTMTEAKILPSSQYRGTNLLGRALMDVRGK